MSLSASRAPMASAPLSSLALAEAVGMDLEGVRTKSMLTFFVVVWLAAVDESKLVRLDSFGPDFDRVDL